MEWAGLRHLHNYALRGKVCSAVILSDWCNILLNMADKLVAQQQQNSILDHMTTGQGDIIK